MVKGPGDTDDASNHVGVELAMAMTRLRARLRVESASSAGKWNWSQLTVLHRIINEGPLTQSALATAEHIRSQSMAELLGPLKDDGLVTTKPDPGDGRKTLLLATVKGKRVAKDVAASREAWLVEAMDRFSTAAERRKLLDAIEVMNRIADCDVRSPTRPS
jgi:DNA-binding MarR family transcriptional regulator